LEPSAPPPLPSAPAAKPEIVAEKKLACPGCGGAAEWNPAKHALVCPFCGTVSPMENPAGETKAEIHELDLVAALQNIGSEQRGWDTEKKSVRCQSCQAVTVFDPTHVAQRCEFCGSAAIIPVEQQGNPIRPESLLEFKLAEKEVRDLAHKWYKTRWFAPNALKRRALTDTVHGAYLPYWTFDAQTHADWTAESGHYYYTTEEYTDSNGKRDTRQVQHTEWRPAAGQLDHFFDDELIPASRGVPEPLLRRIEPFPTTTELKPYNPSYLSGWLVEQYQIDLVAAAKAARERMDGKLRQMCSRAVPGDTQRNLQVYSTYSAQTFKHVLVPVWVLAYTYGPKSYQVVVNGYTGSIAGKHPLSWIKISLLIMAILIVIGIIAAISNKGDSRAPGGPPKIEHVIRDDR
jgi:ribosomal protein S27E